jgi:hypothetical protein
MTYSPPGARPNIANGSGGQPQSNGKRARIVNPILNQSAKIRLKDAERLVRQGRGEWVGDDQLRLILSHPANTAAHERAAAGYEWPAGKIVGKPEMRNIGIAGHPSAVPRHPTCGQAGGFATLRVGPTPQSRP